MNSLILNYGVFIITGAAVPFGPAQYFPGIHAIEARLRSSWHTRALRLILFMTVRREIAKPRREMVRQAHRPE
jgi:hypothetical protein